MGSSSSSGDPGTEPTEYGPSVAVVPARGREFVAVLAVVMVSAVESRELGADGRDEGDDGRLCWVRMLWFSTTSSSVAPASTAARASCSFEYVSWVPSWKPTTQATSTSVPLRFDMQRATQGRRTHTLCEESVLSHTRSVDRSPVGMRRASRAAKATNGQLLRNKGSKTYLETLNPRLGA